LAHSASTTTPVSSVTASDGTTRCGVGIHCKPTKKMRTKMNGEITKSRLQGNCIVRNKKSSLMVAVFPRILVLVG
jgi:hypothetical protein